MRDNFDEILEEIRLQITELAHGCGIGGVLIGVTPCWFAWTPTGVIPRVFASYWAAIGAVAHVMNHMRQELDALFLENLDALDLKRIAGAIIDIERVSPNDPRVRRWTVRVGTATAYLHDKNGLKLAEFVEHDLDQASQYGASLLNNSEPLGSDNAKPIIGVR